MAEPCCGSRSCTSFCAFAKVGLEDTSETWWPDAPENRYALDERQPVHRGHRSHLPGPISGPIDDEVVDQVHDHVPGRSHLVSASDRRVVDRRGCWGCTMAEGSAERNEKDGVLID